jgi:hypothetical protein
VTKQSPTSFRLPKELNDGLTRAANEHRWSKALLLRTILRDWLSRWEKKREAPPAPVEPAIEE